MTAGSVLDTIGDTPLVELTELSPEDGASVFVKVEVAKQRPPDAAVVTVAVDTGLTYLRGSVYREEG